MTGHAGGHSHPHSGAARRPWSEPAPSGLSRMVAWFRRLAGRPAPSARSGLAELPVALRSGELATRYLDAERGSDHQRAGAAAIAAMERALESEDWWPADIWAHRALWHFEQGGLALQAVRQARRIGDLRYAGGDPASARRYYAEAIDEARDIGAEQEQGRAALGLARSLMELGDATGARRLASAAGDLLERAGAPDAEVRAALELRGTEVAVGGAAADTEPGEGEG